MDTLAWWSEHIFLVAIPYFLLGMAWEWHRLRRDGAGKRGYELRDTAVSLTLGVIKLGMIALCAGYAATLLTTAYEYRLFDLPPLAWWTWVLLFFGEDLASACSGPSTSTIIPASTTTWERPCASRRWPRRTSSCTTCRWR
jgi:hypothetical protein